MVSSKPEHLAKRGEWVEKSHEQSASLIIRSNERIAFKLLLDSIDPKMAQGKSNELFRGLRTISCVVHNSSLLSIDKSYIKTEVLRNPLLLSEIKGRHGGPRGGRLVCSTCLSLFEIAGYEKALACTWHSEF